MPWRLLVVDGADAKRFFPLPDNGSVVIGNSHKYSDICLHDLYVARVHCQVDAEGDRVTVTALADDKETLVNGKRVTQAFLEPGEVLRIGNSHLRLEIDDGAPPVVEDEVVEDLVVDDLVVDEGTADAAAVDDTKEAEVVEVLPDDADVAAEEVEIVPDEPESLTWETLDQLAGMTLGHFDVVKMLARGHYGVVFRAFDTHARREVALKVIGPDFPADKDELKRFAAAIKKVAPIHDDHLVRWWAAGKTADYVWISQELVEGDSLAQLMKREETPKLKWRHALKMGLDLAKALMVVHGQRLVHGDLTPPNVLVGLDRVAKLNDLLFDQALKGSAWHRKGLEAKLLSGLPYLAPERLEEGAFWDRAADIYSLGALMYARLTGRVPFEGATTGETIQNISAGQTEKPRKLNKECPDALQNAILKMLAVNPEHRFETAAAVADELERIQSMP